jgi:hypothetical protein
MSARKNITGGSLSTLQPKAHTSRHNRDAAGVNGAKVHVLSENQSSDAAKHDNIAKQGHYLKEIHQVNFRRLMQRTYRMRPKT